MYVQLIRSYQVDGCLLVDRRVKEDEISFESIALLTYLLWSLDHITIILIILILVRREKARLCLLLLSMICSILFLRLRKVIIEVNLVDSVSVLEITIDVHLKMRLK